MKKNVLRCKNENTEDDKYSYLISSCKGINITTPFIEKATIYDEFTTVSVVGNDWKFIEIFTNK